MIFSVISIFPQMFDSLTGYGITKRAFEKKLCQLFLLNPRDFTFDSYQRVDDKPFGGGPGMVMKVEPLELALKQAVLEQAKLNIINPLKVYLSPQGKKIDQSLVNQLSKKDGIIFVCGRYEGVDERFVERNIDLELSIGDFVVSGGEIPAMLLIDSIIRNLPGAVNDECSVMEDSFMTGLLDHPHYTTPRSYDGANVPEVLLNGDHKQIRKWRLQMSLWRTYLRRPDLFSQITLTKAQSGLLDEMIKQHQKVTVFE